MEKVDSMYCSDEEDSMHFCEVEEKMGVLVEAEKAIWLDEDA